MDRPCQFLINYGHPLALGNVFLGLGGPAGVGSTLYQDSSLYRNNGALTNMVPGTDWVWNTFLGRWVLDFHGANPRIVFSLKSSTGTTWSQSAWFFARSSPSYGAVSDFMLGRLAWAWLNGSPSHIGIWDVGWKNLFIAPPLNTWNHMLLVSSAGKHQLWLNGVAGSVVSGVSVSLGGAAAIGNLVDLSYPFDGFISDLLVYDGDKSSFAPILADPSNALLGGLLMPPKRRYYRIGGGTTYHGYPYPILAPMHGGFQR